MAPSKKYYNLSASSSVGAFKVALTALSQNWNSPQTVFQNSTIKVKWYDTDCNEKTAVAAVLDAKETFNPNIIFGPPCPVSLRGVALLAAHWNIPVFDWVSQGEEFQDRKKYSTLVRFSGPLSRFPDVIFHIMSLFSWTQFAVIYDKRDQHRALASAISKSQNKSSYRILQSFEVSNNMEEENIEQIFTELKRNSRIVIMVLPWLDMRRYMFVAYKLGMTKGGFAFLCIHSELYTYDTMESDVFSDKVWRRNDSSDDLAREAFEPVFHILMKSLEKDQWTLFKAVAKEYGDKSYPNWNIPVKPTLPDAYSAHLYDAVLMWAMLTDKLLKVNKNPLDGELMAKMATTLTDKEEVDGLTGRVNIDHQGDRNLDFQVLDMSVNGTFSRIISINYLNKGRKEIKLEGNKTADHVSRWPSGKVGIKNAPPDEPKCGFIGEKCPVTEKRPDSVYIIIISILGALLVVSITIIIYCIFKNRAKPGTYDLNPPTTVRYQNMSRLESQDQVRY
ncbi:atrial natriuretic peptide receptor 3-like [Saccostrea echinata]|uniref:atrial natriuretic peptide receptor 3-like n=1 Tax=Saccostrea echinata TaxID=191078 RepID=UPI002A840863|nr:atrial natriuretic peptide receptor 3-like [Saccostrea echinata]